MLNRKLVGHYRYYGVSGNYKGLLGFYRYIVVPKGVKEGWLICSMSRKGNCWDNVPMESFWGKLKQERLNDKHFRTREEA